MSEMSMIQFNVSNFFALLMNSRPFQPISTLLIKLVSAIITSEPNPDKKRLERVEWIYQNTHEKVMENLSIIELAVFKNLDGGLSKEIDVGDSTFTMIELYKYLDEVALELSKIVTEIAKSYSLDIPMQGMGGNNNNQMSFG